MRKRIPAGWEKGIMKVFQSRVAGFFFKFMPAILFIELMLVREAP